jgi:hypothetical protein
MIGPRCTCMSLRLFLPLLVLPAGNSIAQAPLPTETELRAAYCIPVLQDEIADLHKLLDNIMESMAAGTDDVPPAIRQEWKDSIEKSKRDLPEHIKARESALNRVQLFILPRMPYLDPTALLSATARARADIQENAADTHKCTSQCSTSGQFKSCMIACVNSDLHARLDACRNPTWLPF